MEAGMPFCSVFVEGIVLLSVRRLLQEVLWKHVESLAQYSYVKEEKTY